MGILSSLSKVLFRPERLGVDSDFPAVAIRDATRSLQNSLKAEALEYCKDLGLPPSLIDDDDSALRAWVNFPKTEFAQGLEKSLVRLIHAGLLQVNSGESSRSEMVELILKISNFQDKNQADILIDDAFAQYQRAITVESADALNMNIYQYLGPDDAITSPQCHLMLTINRHGVPGMLYKHEIVTSLHPALTRNPLLGGGHETCRHQWSPVTEDYAISLGFRPRVV